jgi:putative redox protein
MSSQSTEAPDGAPHSVGRDSHIVATWQGEHRFDTGRPGHPTARVDGAGITGQSSPDLLLSALSTCSAIDLLDILGKRRTPAERLTVDVHADRRPEPPRRFVRIDIEYRVDGAAIEAVHAERALDLAFEKYCSVAATIAPDVEVFTHLVLNGERHPPRRQTIWTASAAR